MMEKHGSMIHDKEHFHVIKGNYYICLLLLHTGVKFLFSHKVEHHLYEKISSMYSPQQSHYASSGATFTAIGQALHSLITLMLYILTILSHPSSMYIAGQLSVLLQHLKDPSGPRVSVETERKIEDVRNKAKAVSDAAVPFVKTLDPEYYESK